MVGGSGYYPVPGAVGLTSLSHEKVPFSGRAPGHGRGRIRWEVLSEDGGLSDDDRESVASTDPFTTARSSLPDPCAEEVKLAARELDAAVAVSYGMGLVSRLASLACYSKRRKGLLAIEFVVGDNCRWLQKKDRTQHPRIRPPRCGGGSEPVQRRGVH